MELIIFAHPDDTSSHNAAVLNFVKDVLTSSKKDFDVIDLYADNFSPLYTKEEYQNSKQQDVLVKNYQNRISQADTLIFIYPTWWYGPPAILKGFFDRIFTPGFAYKFKASPSYVKLFSPIINILCRMRIFYGLFIGMIPVDKKLSGKRAIVINTFGGDETGLSLFGRAAKWSVDRAVLEFCGVKPVTRINWFEARGPPTISENLKKKISKAIVSD